MLHKNPQTAIDAYLNALTESQHEECVSSEQAQALAAVEQLFRNANAKLIEPDASLTEQKNNKDNSAIIDIAGKENAAAVEIVNTGIKTEPTSLRDRLPNRFQALLFEVDGLQLAIPLIELGGIFQMQTLNKIPGKPRWLMGMLVKSEMNYQCVNTALWMAPEKYSESQAEQLAYRYAVQLGKTAWVLACSNVQSTHELNYDDIQWRDQGKKRPWLAGMIKQKMCALIDANQLIGLLASKSTDTRRVC